MFWTYTCALSSSCLIPHDPPAIIPLDNPSERHRVGVHVEKVAAGCTFRDPGARDGSVILGVGVDLPLSLWRAGVTKGASPTLRQYSAGPPDADTIINQEQGCASERRPTCLQLLGVHGPVGVQRDAICGGDWPDVWLNLREPDPFLGTNFVRFSG